MIKRFKTLRSVPQLSIDLMLVVTDKRSFYVAVPDNERLNDDNIKQWKISSSLFHHLLFVDFN